MRRLSNTNTNISSEGEFTLALLQRLTLALSPHAGLSSLHRGDMERRLSNRSLPSTHSHDADMSNHSGSHDNDSNNDNDSNDNDNNDNDSNDNDSNNDHDLIIPAAIPSNLNSREQSAEGAIGASSTRSNLSNLTGSSSSYSVSKFVLKRGSSQDGDSVNDNDDDESWEMVGGQQSNIDSPNTVFTLQFKQSCEPTSHLPPTTNINVSHNNNDPALPGVMKRSSSSNSLN